MWRDVNSLKRELALLPRRLHAARRASPSIIVIGGQKCGTSSLFHYLSQHPQIEAPVRKELHYFDLSYYRGSAWYGSHFPLQHSLDRKQRDTGLIHITFEASPYYLYHPAVPARVGKDLPNVKLVGMLRSPVDRACSHYWHERRKGFEDLPLEHAFAAETERLAGVSGKLLQDPRYNSFSHRHHSYLSRGIYIEQIRRWFDVIPKNRFLFIQSEAFFADPKSQTAHVFEFAGLRPCENIGYTPKNTGAYAEISPTLRTELEKFYRPYNEALAEELGSEFAW